VDAPTPVASSPTANGADSGIESQWLAAVKELGRKKGRKYNLGALLRDCKTSEISLDGDTLILAFSNRANLERMQEEMDDPVGQRTVAEIVTKYFGAAHDFRLTLSGNASNGGDNLKPSQNSPLVRTIQGMGGRIVEETVE